MATRKFTRRGAHGSDFSTPSARYKQREKAALDGTVDALHLLLGSFNEARAVILTACRALESTERADNEALTLRIGLKLLDGAYEALDLAIMRLSQ